MTGIRRNDIAIESGYLSGRKKPYLFIRHKGRINGIAQFRDEECAEHFWEVFDYIVNGNESPYILEIVNGGGL